MDDGAVNDLIGNLKANKEPKERTKNQTGNVNFFYLKKILHYVQLIH